MTGSRIRCLIRPARPAVVLMVIVLAGCGGQSSSDPGQAATKSAPTSTPTPKPAPTPSASRSAAGIPDDFPLALGLVADGDNKVTTPRRNGKGVGLERTCWGAAWPGAAVDRMVVEQVGPELAVTRELAVYPDRATATAVGERVRVRAAHCHQLPTTSEGAAMDVTLERDVDTGGAHSAVSFAETLTGGQPGGSVFVFTQVGRAVLAVEDSGEWTRGSARDGVRDLKRTDRALLARMCVFRDAGC
jgi:hypothetical protein